MKSTLLFSLLLSLAVSDSIRDLFRDAMQKYAATDRILLKSESPEMLEKRFKSFAKFHAMVEEVNNDDSLPYRARDNFLSILTEEERKLRLGLNVTEYLPSVSEDLVLRSVTDVPEKRDFSSVLPDIKDQQTCGSCWTFGAAGSLEGEIFFKTGKRKVSLSEQEYMECSTTNNACRGGWPTTCYDYSRRTGRVAPNSAYKYLNRDRMRCNANDDTPNALADSNVLVMGSTYLSTGDENLLTGASEHIISVAIYANGYFMGYDDGLYVDDTCQERVNHAVNVVGYGTKENRKYWKIRNSWGLDWGEKGYMFMDREKKNMCKISTYPHYPKVACRNAGTCTAPNPDEGDTSDEEEEEKEDEGDGLCFRKPISLTGCKNSYKAAQKLCPDAKNCTIARFGKKCFMVQKKSKDDSRKVMLPCIKNATWGSDQVCTRKFYLGGCMASEETARQHCAYDVPAWRCMVVKKGKCFYATNGAKSGKRWLDRTFPCQEFCNTQGGMVYCSDCNCCKHKHVCPDTNTRV